MKDSPSGGSFFYTVMMQKVATLNAEGPYIIKGGQRSLLLLYIYLLYFIITTFTSLTPATRLISSARALRRIKSS